MIGVSSYSFGEYQEKLGVKGIIQKAKEMGFDAIEFAELGVDGDKQFLIDTAKQYKEWAEEANIKINNFAVGADLIYPRCGGTSITDEIKRICDVVDIAEALGVDKMRHDVTWAYEGKLNLLSFIKVLPILADSCREITKYAEDKGIKTMFENHGFFVQKADRCEALLESVDHKNFGILIDMGNFLCGDDNNINSVKTLAKYAFHVHGKDFVTLPYTEKDPKDYFPSAGGTHLKGCALGEGVVNPVLCMEILKDMGYKGDISLEYEGFEDNIIGIEKGFKVLKNNWR